MTNVLKVAILVLTVLTACSAQEALVTVRSKGKQGWPAAELNKVYLSSCSAVQREFGGDRASHPRISLFLGADRDTVDFDKKEIRLVKWDRNLFAEGVVILAFEDLMPVQRRLTVAKRAVIWADATVEVGQIEK